MRPILLKFQCFGPYMEEQTVDFEQLHDKGIFLICGETGAGKTTILDAICYALYGESSSGERGALKEMRCKQASAPDRTIVEFTFASGVRIYRFVRTLRYGTKNIIEEQNCMEEIEGAYVPIQANPTATFVRKQAEAIIGLNAAQFRQVVILPQGMFERFLVSDSGEKEKVLTTIFHTEKWASVTKTMKEKVEEQVRRSEEKRRAIALLLEQQDCRSQEELAAGICELETEETRLCAELEKAQQQKKDASVLYEQALSENPDFLELERRKEELAGLLKEQERMEEEKQAAARADAAAELISVHEQYTAAQEAAKEACEAVENARSRREELTKEERMFDSRREQHKKQSSLYEKNQERRIALKAAEPVYREYETKREALLELQNKVQALQTACASAEEEYHACYKAWERCRNMQEKEFKRYQEVNSIYVRNTAGRLAEGLNDGVPCPVCGSVHHPAPAASADGESVSEAELEKRNAALTKAGAEVTNAWQQTAVKNREREAAKEQLAQNREVLSNVQTQFDSIVSHKIAGIDTFEQWREQVRKTKQQIAVYEEEETNLAQQERLLIQQMSAAKQALAEKEHAYGTAQQRAAESRAKWQKRLLEKGFQTEEQFLAACVNRKELDACKERLAKYWHGLAEAKRRLSEQQDKVKGRKAPQLQCLKQEQEAAEKEFLDRSKAYASLVSDRQAKCKAYESLRKLQQAYQQQRQTAESNMEFVKQLLPKSGISLQTYVLGIMLTSVTAAANRLLRNVHGGRYQLFRTNEGISANKAGLELEILDYSNGQRRSVKTLSGGEKFLVALSLAIGLSTVVQTQNSGGLRLEAMFIDEGFGSLDQSSIGDALDILQHIQNSHGLVGIISHVDRLKETIPVQLEIIKEQHGSTMQKRI